MFSYMPGKLFKKPEIEIYSLSHNSDWIHVATNWSSEHSTGLIADEEGFVEANKNFYYMLVYGKNEFAQPIGMFALFDIPIDPIIKAISINNKPPIIKELNCVYISKNFRGLGIGATLIREAKKIAKDLGADMIVFDTLNPNLNHFYKKNGAKVICESRYPKGERNSNPTTVLSISL